MELVRAERQEVHVGVADIYRYLADSLYGVGMEQRSVVMRDPGEFLHGKDQAGLVIRPHDRNEGGFIRVDIFLEDLPVDNTVAVERKLDHFDSELGEKTCRIGDTGMFDRRNDDLRAFAVT